jgi:hypothetical protein
MPDRVAFIAARIATLASHEQYLIEEAIKAGDADTARHFVRAADTAHEDALAIAEEHGLDG